MCLKKLLKQQWLGSGRKARDSVRRKGGFELSGLPGKLADCQISKQEGTELYIVEEIQQEVQQNGAETENFKQFYP